jgi:hypothetical protein
MTSEIQDRWHTARTLADLGGLTAAFFSGYTDYHPEQMQGDQHHTDDPTIALTIADLNAAGFVTVDYLPGVSLTQGRAVEQRAAVQGFCDTITLEWLTAGLYGTRHQVVVTSTAPGGLGITQDLNPGVPVLGVNGRTMVRFGRQFTTTQIRDVLYGGILTDQAADTLITSWNVTIFDPVWDSADLWPVLARIADPEPMLLARQRRQALPAA